MEEINLVPIDYETVENRLTAGDEKYQRIKKELFDIADDYERVLKQLTPEDRHAVEEYCTLRWEQESRAAELLANHYAVNGASIFKADYL